MAAHESGSFRSGQVGVIGACFSRHDYLDHRRAVADAHTAHAFHLHLHRGFFNGLAQRVKKLVAAFGDAARAQADVNGWPLFLAIAGVCGQLGRGGFRRGPLTFLIFCDQLRYVFRAGMAERCFVDLHHGRKRAAAEAGDGFDGELPLRVRVVSLRDVQMPPQRIFHARRARDVAGGATANAHHRLARGFVPEHVVKRRHAFQRGGGDFTYLADALQRFWREIAEAILHRLENRNERLGFAPEPRHGLVNERKVGHAHGSPMQ